MSWLVQPSLVNDPFSDPGLLLDFRFGRRALLFDLGDLTPLSPRQLLRVSHAFVSHAHMDHFAGFDRLLRVCLHRTMPLHLIGPAGFADRVEHKLSAYTLNLLEQHPFDFLITAVEFVETGVERISEFRAREAFRRQDLSAASIQTGTVLDEDEFRIKSVVLDHGTPCLAFSFEEKLRVNVWSEGLKSLRLGVGPWLNEAKRAVRRGAPDDSEVVISRDLSIPLGVLKKHALRTARGQKIAYVVDAAYHEENVVSIIALARRHSSMQMRTLLHRGDTLRRVKLVISQGEQALPDLSLSTSRPATASRRTGFEARQSKPSARKPAGITLGPADELIT